MFLLFEIQIVRQLWWPDLSPSRPLMLRPSADILEAIRRGNKSDEFLDHLRVKVGETKFKHKVCPAKVGLML